MEPFLEKIDGKLETVDIIQITRAYEVFHLSECSASKLGSWVDMGASLAMHLLIEVCSVADDLIDEMTLVCCG
jgi:hypothetical protein